MSRVTVRIPTPLRSFAGGQATLAADGGTVGEVLQQLARDHEGLGERILDGEGRLRSFVNVYLGEEDVTRRGGLDAAVSDGDVLSVIPAVAGG